MSVWWKSKKKKKTNKGTYIRNQVKHAGKESQGLEGTQLTENLS